MNVQISMTNVGPRSGEPPTSAESKASLEAYTRRELDDDQLIAALLLNCRRDSGTTEETLSLLDQYHRRGLLDTSAFLFAKTELNMLLFCSQPTDRVAAAERSSDVTALDNFSDGLFD